MTRVGTGAIVFGLLWGIVSFYPLDFGFAALSNNGSVTETFTLESSLERAFQNNAELLAAEKEMLVAKAQLSQAKSLFYPKINLNLNYARYRNETLGLTQPELGGFILEAPIEGPQGDRSNPLADNLYLGRVGFQQTLFAGGRLKNTLKLSQANIKQSENRFETLRNDVTYVTRKNFFTLLGIRKRIAVLELATERLEKIRSRQTSRHGRLSAQQAQSHFRRRITGLKKKEKQAQLDFLQSMGMELFNTVKLEGDFDSQQIGLDFQRALAMAKDHRAELRDTAIQEEVDQLSVDLSMAERYPVFKFGGDYEFRDRKFPLDETNWSLVLSMNIPLFDGFSSLGRIKESRYRAQKGRLERVRLEDQIEKEIRAVYNDYDHWKNELEMREKEYRQLKEVENDYLKSGRGSAKTSEQIEFLRWMADAEENRIEGIYQLNLAYARLEKSLGRPLEEAQ